MREIFKFIVQEELTTPIASVRIPCALIWGSLDQITPVWIAKKMHDAITNSSLTIIEDADHGVSYKKPKEFSEYVDTFLKSL
jgi:pimeloyl-ACP methyl ester carboxylesterase